MRIHFIEEDNKKVMFFPDSLRFYKINDISKEIVESIIEGKSEGEIVEKFNIDLDTYNKFKNLLYKEEILEEVTAKREHELYKLVLNITNKCNLACKYCYANGGNYCSSEGIMKVETAKATLDTFLKRYRNIRVIQFFGGEPTFNLDVIEFVCKYFKEKFEKKEIDYIPTYGTVTNGTNISDRFIELINDNKIQVTVSFDGPEQVNDKMRIFKSGKGTTSTILNNIKKLQSKTNEPQGIEVTYNRAHVEENLSVKDVVKYIKDDIKVDNIHLVPVSGDEDSNFTLKNTDVFKESVKDIFGEKVNNNKNYGYSLITRVVQALNLKKTNKYLCEAGISNYSVSILGDIYPCFMLTDIEKFKIGSVYDPEVLGGIQYKNIINKLESFSKFKGSKCENCFNNKICTGCIGSNYFKTGDIHDTKEDDCIMYRSITEKVILELASAN